MNRLLCLLVVMLTSFCSFGQSETHDFITYDSVVNYTTAYPGSAGGKWTLRISRPRNYFTANHPDTASRQGIFTMPGAGQVGTDTNYLTAFGPHYWMQNGWDGGVQLGNGKHYPIYITVVQSGANTRPWFLMALMDSLMVHYHFQRKKITVIGFSMGGWTWGRWLAYSHDGIDTHCMGMIQSFIGLEGQDTQNFVDYSGNQLSFDKTAWAKWARLYNGKYFGWEGNRDNRGMWLPRDSIANAGFAGNAFFSYQDMGTDGLPHPDGSNGGGSHCCWNSWYDPNFTNYLTSPTVVVQTNHANSGGTYYEPTNLYQWALRQGDTTLIGGCAPSVDAGANKFVQLPTNSVVETGIVSPQCGHTISSYAWSEVSGPSTATITNGNTITATFSNLVAGTYVFQLLVTDNTALASSDNTNVVVTATQTPSVSAGGPQTITQPASSTFLTGTASGNNGATITGTLWTQVSGPATAIITDPTLLTTAINALSAVGVYVFKLTATDNNFNSNFSTVTITVATATPPTPIPKIKIGAGEYQIFFLDQNKRVYAQGGNLSTQGVGNSGTAGLPLPVVVSPSNLQFNVVAGGLHGGAGIDVNGNAWTWGDNSQAQYGTGSTTSNFVGNQIVQDSSGAPFTNIAQLTAFFVGNNNNGWYAVKTDGTLWGWGAMLSGARLNGTDSIAKDSLVLRPIQIATPGGRLVKKICAGQSIIVLFTDGTVWTAGNVSSANLGYTKTGTSYQSLHQLTSLSSIVDITGGGEYNYAVGAGGINLWGWGISGSYMGLPAASGRGTAINTPTLLTNIMTVFAGRPINQIVVNQSSTYAILSDSTLQAWGDNAQGTIGNGEELDYTTTTQPYAWPFLPGLLLQQLPYQVTNLHSFVGVWATTNFGFYAYAETLDGQLYSWGRNKALLLGNGFNQCSSNQAAIFANSLDVAWPTPVNPLGLSVVIKISCPICAVSPSTSGCSDVGCTIPTLTTTANAGPDQLLKGSVTQLDGTASTSTGVIQQYLWTQVSGPSVAQFDVNTAKTPIVRGLVPGTYVFRLQIKDNAWNTRTDNVVVSSTSNPIYWLLKRLFRKRLYLVD